MLANRARSPLIVRFPASGVWAGESRHAPGFVMSEVTHEFFKLLYVFSGKGWVEREGVRSSLQAGDVVWVPAGCRHRLIDAPRRLPSLYVVCVRRDVLAALPGAAGALAGFRHFSRPAWGGDLREAVRRLLHEQTLGWPGADAFAWSAAWAAIGLVWRMDARTMGKANAQRRGHAHDADPARARVAAYAESLATNFLQARDLEKTAEGLGLSRRRFTALFREINGDSWKQCVRKHQIEHACRLLRGTRRSIRSISYECGFSDVTAFHRAFRAVRKNTPSAWREAG